MTRFFRFGPITLDRLLLAPMPALFWVLNAPEGASLQVGQSLASISLLLLAYFKVRLVIIHIMEIKGAPHPLHLVCAAWLALVCAALIAIYLSGMAPMPEDTRI